MSFLSLGRKANRSCSPLAAWSLWITCLSTSVQERMRLLQRPRFRRGNDWPLAEQRDDREEQTVEREGCHLHRPRVVWTGEPGTVRRRAMGIWNQVGNATYVSKPVLRVVSLSNHSVPFVTTVLLFVTLLYLSVTSVFLFVTSVFLFVTSAFLLVL